MASYQDIDTRLRVVEDMLMFLMTATRMRTQVDTGVVDENGAPILKWMEGTILDYYRAAKGAGMEMDQRG